MIKARILTLVSLMVVYAASFSGSARAEDCRGPLGPKCGTYTSKLDGNACLQPGSTLLNFGKGWVPIRRKKVILTEPTTLQFFYVVDGTLTKQENGVLFVGIERTQSQNVSRDVNLSRNINDEFEATVVKETYSRAVNLQSAATQVLRRWAFVPGVGSVWSVDQEILRKFDFPQAVRNDSRRPHARLYRFEAGSISCIPFNTEVTSDDGTVLGVMIDVYGGAKEPADTFHIDLEWQ
jgi:hypothetical protein